MTIAATSEQSRTSNVIPFGRAAGRCEDRVDAAVQATSDMRIALVEWRIEPGREADFLDHWSRREVVPERDGLIGEFLNRVDDGSFCPWISWPLDPRWTTYLAVSLWSTAESFHDQVGYKINDSEPALPFEAERRRRIFVAPERWRPGGTALPLSDHARSPRSRLNLRAGRAGPLSLRGPAMRCSRLEAGDRVSPRGIRRCRSRAFNPH